MKPTALFGSHLYSQIVVPLIAASVGVAVVASIASAFFLSELTERWVSQVAESTTAGVVQRWEERDVERRDFIGLLASDAGAATAADAGDEASLRSLVASDSGVLTEGALVAIDRAGRVVASGGAHAPALGTRIAMLPSDWVRMDALPTVYSTQPTASISALHWLGAKHEFALAYTTPLKEILLTDSSQSAGAGFSFYDESGRSLAAVASSALPTASAKPLLAALSGSEPLFRSAIQAVRSGRTAEGTIDIGGTRYRYVLRRAEAPRAPVGAAAGFILGAVSEQVSQEAAKTSTNLIVVWSTIAVLALMGLGFWVARRVSDPLVELTDGARRIAEGDFSTKVEVTGGNELAVLGDAFNEMTDSLRDRSEALTKKVLELAMLYEMSRALGSTLDMDGLLGSTLESALRIFDLDVGYVALRDRDTGALGIRAVRGAELTEPGGAEAVRSSMAEWVVREGRPLIFNPDPGATDGHIDVLTGAKAALCVPLVSAEGTIGAITVGSSDDAYRFNSDDVRLLSTIGNHVTIAVGNIELFSSLQEAYLATVRSLAAAVDAKDSFTRGHSEKVAMYATLVAHEMGLSHEQLTALEMAAYLHDIGKIGIPEEILLKPGKLTDGEMVQMRHHPLIGANILKPVAFPWAITPIVRHHHEFWNGDGYPAGLKGEEIPLLARILCVADSYEAMTADRPYRVGRSPADAIEELHRCSGTQFDPRVVEYMTAVVESLERDGSGVIAELGEDISTEEARAIFAAIVDGVLASFRRLGGPRLAANVESELDDYLKAQNLSMRVLRGRMTFTEESGGEIMSELAEMRAALHRIDAIISRVSGSALVQHFYDDALEGFSGRMRQLAVALEFYTEE